MELKFLFPRGWLCQRVLRSVVVPAGAGWSLGSLGQGWPGLLPLCSVVVARIPVQFCLLAMEHQVPKAFSSKPWGYLRSPLSFMVRAKAELISRRDLQEIGRQIRWEKGGTVGARRKTGVPQEGRALSWACQATRQVFVTGRYTTLIKSNP